MKNNSPGTYDGMYIRGLSARPIRKIDDKILLRGPRKRGVRLKSFDIDYREPLEEVLNQAKQEFEGNVIVGASAGGSIATLLGLELGVPVVTVSSRRRTGNYPPDHKDSLEVRAKGAPGFWQAIDRLEAMELAPDQLGLITDIRPRGGDSIVRESETHLHPSVRLIEVSPSPLAIRGLDHVHGIAHGLSEISKNSDGEIIVGRRLIK